MDIVNIFTATTIKGPAKQEAVGHFIIELIHDGESMTYPPEGKDTYIYRESTTATALTTELFANALYLIPFLLKKYSRDEIEAITCWMEPIASGPYCNRWFDKWQQDGWINSKGEPVKDADKWKRLILEMEKLSKRFIFTSAHNSYQNLMQSLAIKELKKRKTLEMIQRDRQKAGV